MREDLLQKQSERKGRDRKSGEEKGVRRRKN